MFQEFFLEDSQIEHFETPVSHSELLPQGIQLSVSRLSLLFSPHFFPDMRHMPCAPLRAQAGADGWGESANNRQQVVQKQQLVDNMCSLDLRPLHRQSKVSCHKTIN